MEPSLVDGGASPLRTGAVVCLAQVVDGVTYRLRSSRCCQLGCSFAPARDGFREDFQFRVVAARSFPAASARRRPPRHGGEAGEGGGFSGRRASDASPECLGLTFVDGAAPGGRATFSLAPVYRSQRDGAAVTDGEEVLLVSRGKFRLSAEAVGLPGGGVAREALFFNFVVALLLLNMVAGIIIDTFSQLSQESLEASKIKMNECFTTGLHRSQFETLKEVDFDLDHKPRCAMLNYVHFIGYVMHKDCVNDSPLERAVRDKLRDGDASWIPTLTSARSSRTSRSDARLDALAAAVADLARGAARDRAPTADDARPP
ncbi:hypothetical protein JL722_778 [Aureococcus anophagefferens]|nr:hypothetical protein JL722_778 [Aureococcus anophagefferens]